MRKHGIHNFYMEVIEELELESISFEREIYWIAFYKTNICKYGKEFGYNLTDGGEGASGYIYSEEQIKRMSEAHMGENNGFFGKTHSDITKKKISDARTGQIIPNETKEKISKSLLDKHMVRSEETRDKIRKAITGIKRTPEQCENIRKSKIGKSNNRPGSKHHNAKLTENEVIEMREFFDNTVGKSKDKILVLAIKYGISVSGVKQIVYRTKWKHIP